MNHSSRAAALCVMLAAAGAAGAGAETPYTAEDFTRIHKFDSHVHVNTADGVFLKIAAKDGFELLSINVDYPDFPPLAMQARVAHKLQAEDPKHFHFLTTFSMQGFGGPTWTADTVRHIDSETANGAVGVKVWK